MGNFFVILAKEFAAVTSISTSTSYQWEASRLGLSFQESHTHCLSRWFQRMPHKSPHQPPTQTQESSARKASSEQYAVCLDERVEQLLLQIKPGYLSEQRRHSVATYACTAISNCFAPENEVEHPYKLRALVLSDQESSAAECCFWGCR